MGLTRGWNPVAAGTLLLQCCAHSARANPTSAECAHAGRQQDRLKARRGWQAGNIPLRTIDRSP